MSKLIVVLDTNIIIASASRYSPYKKILENLLEGIFEIYVTTEIWMEYEEKVKEKFLSGASEYILNGLLLSQNVHLIEPWFNFFLIAADTDDNKFSDCAIASNADYLVTNDKHFNIIKASTFPKLNVINIDEFAEILKTL